MNAGRYSERVLRESKVYVTVCGMDNLYVDNWSVDCEDWRRGYERRVTTPAEWAIYAERKMIFYSVEKWLLICAPIGLYLDFNQPELIRRVQRWTGVGDSCIKVKGMRMGDDKKGNAIICAARMAIWGTELGKLCKEEDIRKHEQRRNDVDAEREASGLKALPRANSRPPMGAGSQPTMGGASNGCTSTTSPPPEIIIPGDEVGGKGRDESILTGPDEDDEDNIIVHGIVVPRNPFSRMMCMVMKKSGIALEWPMELEELRRVMIANGLSPGDEEDMDYGVLNYYLWNDEYIICAGHVGTYMDMGMIGLMVGLMDMGMRTVNVNDKKLTRAVCMTRQEGNGYADFAVEGIKSGRSLVGLDAGVLELIKVGDQSEPWRRNIRYKEDSKLKADYYCVRPQRQRLTLSNPKRGFVADAERERMMKRSAPVNLPGKKEINTRFDENLIITTVGMGMFTGKIRIVVRSEWGTEATERLEQLKRGVTIELTMARRARETEDNGKLPQMIFGGKEGLSHVRVEADDSGGKALVYEELVVLAERKDICIAYALDDGSMRIRTIGTYAFGAMRDKILAKLNAVAMEMGKWATTGKDSKVVDLDVTDKKVMEASREAAFYSRHIIVSNIRMDERSDGSKGLLERVMTAATRNIASRVEVDEVKLNERLSMGIHGMVRVGDLGLQGVDATFSRYGVLVELVREVEVGADGSQHEIKVSDKNRVTWDKDRQKSEEYYIRQFVTVEEAQMFNESTGGDRDWIFAGVRNVWRRNEVDDYIRWNLKRMWEDCLGGTVYVWLWTIRHKIGNSKGQVREETIFLCLSSGGNCRDMGRNLFGRENTDGDWGISVENFGLELFTGYERIKDRVFKGVVGSQKDMIELNGCPLNYGVKEVLNLICGSGVTKVGAVIRRNIKGLGDRESRWYIVPMDGETTGNGEIARGRIKGVEWVMWSITKEGVEYDGFAEQIHASIVWADGNRIRWDMDNVEEESLSSKRSTAEVAVRKCSGFEVMSEEIRSEVAMSEVSMTESSLVTAGMGDRGVSILEVGRMIAAKGDSDEKRMERLESKMDQNMAMFVRMFENFQATQTNIGGNKGQK